MTLIALQGCSIRLRLSFSVPYQPRRHQQAYYYFSAGMNDLCASVGPAPPCRPPNSSKILLTASSSWKASSVVVPLTTTSSYSLGPALPASPSPCSIPSPTTQFPLLAPSEMKKNSWLSSSVPGCSPFTVLGGPFLSCCRTLLGDHQPQSLEYRRRDLPRRRLLPLLEDAYCRRLSQCSSAYPRLCR